MKRICTFLFVVFVLTIASQAQIRTAPSDIVSKDNANIDLVKAIFENSLYEIKETASSYIQIKDVFNIYVDLDKDNRYLTYSVNWPINENFSQSDKLNLLNKIAKEVIMVTPYYSESGTSLIVKTNIWIEGGNTVKNIVLAEKIFVKALNLILDKDTQQIIK